MNAKRLVAAGYDRIAADMLRLATTEPPGRKVGYLERTTLGLTPTARVLDLGCGPGLQAAWLAERFRVIGVDISRAQLALAQERAPEASFLLADMCSLAFAPRSFDAIVAFYSVIHVPREEHAALFASMHRWLQPRGRLLVVLGSKAWEAVNRTGSTWVPTCGGATSTRTRASTCCAPPASRSWSRTSSRTRSSGRADTCSRSLRSRHEA